MTLPFGTEIVSRRTGKRGVIVGYGTLMWPTSEYMGGDGGIPQPVYLVQLRDGPAAFLPGSSSLGPACAVFRADMIDEVGEGGGDDH